MRILISGGGLAGLTLAYWLQQYGFTPVVIEQASDLRRSGYAIDFFGTGYDVADRMGLIDNLKDQQLIIDGVSYIDNTQHVIAKLDIALMQKVMHQHYMGLMHWSLEEALYQAVVDNVEVRFGCSLKAVEQDADGVTVTFDNDQTERFDLLIGADGIHSNTRQLVFGPESQFGRYLGYYVACYPLPDRYGIGHSWKNYTEPGRQVGAYPSNREGEIFTFFMWTTPDVGYIPHAERLNRLREAFAGMGWIADQLLNDVTNPDAIYMDTVTQINMPTWSHGRVALVGDAASCLTLISGQGSSMAMGGAYVLAQALRENADYAAAFQQYETRMRPEIDSRQKSARDFAKAFVPGSQLELMLQKLMFKVVLRAAFIGLLRKQFGAGSILQPQST